MHSGGIADKVGNRYEATWLIRHLVQLIDGRASAVTIELLGDDGVGFEFCIERPTHREWHQCKRQTSGSWTINRLTNEGVLANFKAIPDISALAAKLAPRFDRSYRDPVMASSECPVRHCAASE